ncbi:MAG: hypothetical protein [Siphoviridae sp. ctpQM7]|nr:MAG: hypothetical protein [Siphoviridae sp. ctpQM7]
MSENDDFDFDSLLTTPKTTQFTLPSQGLHKDAVCTKVQVQPSTFQGATPDDKVVSFWWETNEEDEGADGSAHKRKVFSKRYSLFTGAKAGLNQFCLDLTGKTLLESGIAERTADGRISWKNLRCFQEMVADLTVKHVDGKDRKFANIASVLTSDGQKKHNQEFLPKA